jgi:hypothetical protein
LAAHAVGAGVANLHTFQISTLLLEEIHQARRAGGTTDLDLEEVLGWTVDLIEALLARVRHGLQDGTVAAGA